MFRPARDLIEIAGSANSVQTALQSDTISVSDIIILDLWIPDEKPLENIKILKETFPFKPILIYSTEDSSVWIRKMMIAGAKGYVTKDALRQDLKAAVQSLASGGAWFTKSMEVNDLELISREISEHEVLLSSIQKKILTELINGNSQKEIARILNTHERNIEKSLRSLKKRFKAKTTVELIKILIDKALI
jgi:DNA-binding NarL/FixJ family response regulator